MKLNKFLAVILTVALLVCALPTGVFNFTANAATNGYYTYTVSNGEATITDCNTSISGDVTIPSTLGGYPVTSIGNYAFYNCNSLTSITITDSVTSIGIWAFCGCNSLTSITIPESVISIGNDAFINLSSLENVYITDIAKWCAIDFENTESNPLFHANNLYVNGKLITNLEIPHGVTTLPICAFSCENIISVTIPDSVTSIENRAFWGCRSLTNVTIPESVTSIGSATFYNCSSLTQVTIPDSVTSIDPTVFYNCSSLTSVTIPDSITSIGESAFYNCSSLTSITIPDSVTSIAYNAFKDCTSLKNVFITDMSKWCAIDFQACSNPLCYGGDLYLNSQLVTNLEIPQDTTAVNQNGFYNCKTIENIFIPKNTVLINQYAFYGCSNIKNIYYEGTAEEWQEVTVLKGNDYITNATVYYNCKGIPGAVTGIELTKLPDKLQYLEEQEKLDLTGGVLTVKYDGGATQAIDLTTLTVEGFDNTVLGKQTLTVKYGRHSVQFEVEIVTKPIEYLAVYKLPQKVKYTVGEQLDLIGAKLVVEYTDGTHKFIDITADMVTGYNKNITDLQLLTVTYKTHTAKIVVGVYQKADFDFDGYVNAADATILTKEIFNENYDVMYDINEDGTSNIIDVVKLKKMLLDC